MRVRRSYVLLGAALLALAGVGAWLGSAARVPAPVAEANSPTPGEPWFVDVTTAAGIDFRHYDSTSAQHYVSETMGSGAAWIDYDQDGWPDLFFAQAGPLPQGDPRGPSQKLYRNQRDGTFRDVTAETGLTRAGFGVGCAVGDYDNDGFDDLLVTFLSGVALYHNEPDGLGRRHFVDVTARAGLDNPHWGTSCGWGDVDGDGLLDLYICNYVVIDFEHYTPCYHSEAKKNYPCPPNSFRHVKHRLFRNKGDGRFEDVTESSGVGAAPPAPGLGVVLVDLDGDGRLDMYVVNDMQPAYLFHNRGGGRFAEVAWSAGCACMGGGRYIAGMGIQAGDVDGSGRPSLLLTNYQREPAQFFRNQGGLLFQDWSYPSGLGPATVTHLGFGMALCDVDRDGHLDLALANGHVVSIAPQIFGDPYEQEAQLFLGDGAAHFREVSARAGAYFRERRVGRGLAWADYNNDGLPDLLYTHNADRPALLNNATATDRHWLRLELQGDGQKSNRNAIGARVEVEVAGRTLVHFVTGGGSYLSASERRLLLGLDQATQAERVRVRWPSGRVQQFGPLAADAGYLLCEGENQVERRR